MSGCAVCSSFQLQISEKYNFLFAICLFCDVIFLYQLIIIIILQVVLKRYQLKPGAPSFYMVFTHTMKKSKFHAKALISHEQNKLILPREKEGKMETKQFYL